MFRFVGLIDDGPFSSFQGRSLSASSLHAYLPQTVDGVTSLALCLRVVSQGPQHFRSSDAIHLWWLLFSRQCTYLLGHCQCLRHVQGSTSTVVFESGCQTLTHAGLGFPFRWASHSVGLPIPLFTFVAANLCGNQPLFVKGRDQSSSTGLPRPSSNHRHHWLHRSLSLVIRWQ